MPVRAGLSAAGRAVPTAAVAVLEHRRRLPAVLMDLLGRQAIGPPADRVGPSSRRVPLIVAPQLTHPARSSLATHQTRRVPTSRGILPSQRQAPIHGESPGPGGRNHGESVMVRRTVGIVVLAACVGTAHAFRCGHEIVRSGDSKAAVMEKCGQPAHQHGHRWFYDTGSSFLVREVLFVDDKVWRMRAVRPAT